MTFSTVKSGDDGEIQIKAGGKFTITDVPTSLSWWGQVSVLCPGQEASMTGGRARGTWEVSVVSTFAIVLYA